MIQPKVVVMLIDNLGARGRPGLKEVGDHERRTGGSVMRRTSVPSHIASRPGHLICPVCGSVHSCPEKTEQAGFVEGGALDPFGYFHPVRRKLRAQAAPTSVKGSEAQQCPGRTDGMLSVQGGRRREGAGQLCAEADRLDQGKPRTDENWAMGRSRAPPSSGFTPLSRFVTFGRYAAVREP